MITSKQRAYLRSLANGEPTIMQIGKGGISENMIKTISDALEARELIKLSVLENCGYTPREAADELGEALGAEVAGVIGRKIILYRESEKNKRIELWKMPECTVRRIFSRPCPTKPLEYQGISKNSSHADMTVLFPSYVTKFFRIGTTMRADFCLV